MTCDDDFDSDPDAIDRFTERLGLRLHRLVAPPRRWLRSWRRLRDMEIDWCGFGLTRGGFSGGFGSFGCQAPRFYDPLTSITWPRDAVLTVPEQARAWMRAWDPWARWTPPWPTLADVLPKLSAPRGGIRFTLSPPP